MLILIVLIEMMVLMGKMSISQLIMTTIQSGILFTLDTVIHSNKHSIMLNLDLEISEHYHSLMLGILTH